MFNLIDKNQKYNILKMQKFILNLLIFFTIIIVIIIYFYFINFDRINFKNNLRKV